MKNTHKLLISYFLFPLLLLSCTNDNEYLETDKTDLIVTMDDLGFYDAITTLKLESDKEFLIIKDTQTYAACVKGNTIPVLDFNQKQLIIGRYYSSKEIENFNYKLFKTNELLYKLTVIPTFSSNDKNKNKPVFDYTYHIILPRDESIDELNVIFSISSL
nr:hypothetical protein [uncultured Carboxylicivirga sp.]